jgi:hypothetical protein
MKPARDILEDTKTDCHLRPGTDCQMTDLTLTLASVKQRATFSKTRH